MKLEDLIKNVTGKQLKNFENVEISGISYNSKTTKKGDIFVCLKGEHSDGHEFAKMAYENGASAFFCEHELDLSAPQVIVPSTRHQIAEIAAEFYEYPSRKTNLIGVTGTNGKTTVTHLLQRIFEDAQKKCALIGTLGYKLSGSDTYHEAKHTTPQAPELQHTLKTICEKGIDYVAMEVSSHALEQNRVGGCEYKGAVFTNLTQDHLDYHITMNNYFEAKAILFKGLKAGCFAVINKDDEYAQRFIDVVPQGVKICTYGIKNDADITASNIDFSIHGAKFDCKIGSVTKRVQLQMNGMFSVYNALAALAGGIAAGVDEDICIKALEETQSVAGRFEIVNKQPLVIVDYAHTPDGLQNVLKAARELTPENGNLICMFGCGGDRDATKRPKMGKIADDFADIVVVTSDNPRSENPQLIISDIMTGIKSVNTRKVYVEPDRRAAIAMLKKISKPEDVVLLAGKGHEDYQILKDKTIHFDDREEARAVFG
ncbi:TPA: UDP-N-acetylmuramoyl-L-alanyl-D-glutamate--2,6-diaminopimelate ligase [Candidatus Spyradomonas excrementavium]|nr:UDP-N-acetylmuramoyl-L-alanyl-D-glutamate--2,6-diaminopimelate ligase [Candidatus Spyradomonas excrementavium]